MTAPPVRLRLYIAGEALNLLQAISNLREICRRSSPELRDFEIVDVLRHPKRALADGILMTPTLLRLDPLPLVRIVGSLSESARALLALGLPALA